MLEIVKTNTQNNDFLRLVKELDAGLVISDGEDHAFYDQYNKLNNIKYVLVAFQDGKAAGCGAIKSFDEQTMEVKRMYVRPQNRGQKIATQLLQALEDWAVELGANRCILETGRKQPEAVALYHRCNYQVMSENYGQYAGVENSICFEKYVR